MELDDPADTTLASSTSSAAPVANSVAGNGRSRSFRPPIRWSDLVWIFLVWAATAFNLLFVEFHYDEFSNAELIYYSFYNVGIGALVGFFLYDRIDRFGLAGATAAAAGLILGGTLINEILIEPVIFRTGPMNSEGLYYGVVDASMFAGVFVLFRVARQLNFFRERLVELAATRLAAPETASFFVRVAGETRRIFPADLLYMRAEKDFTRIICRNGEHFVSESLKSLVERVQPFDIVRVHKSFAVNLGKVDRLTRGEAWIGDIAIPVGRRYAQSFAEDWTGTSADECRARLPSTR